MGNRNTLHISHLEPFKAWLIDQNVPFRDGKGDFQVMQVETSQGWQVIYSRLDMPEHYTVGEKLMPLVREFLRDRKSAARQPYAWHFSQQGFWHFTTEKRDWYDAPGVEEVIPLYTATGMERSE